MTKAEIKAFYLANGWKESTRSPRLILSPTGLHRIALNPRHVRHERKVARNTILFYYPGSVLWTRTWSSRYADLFLTPEGKLTSSAWVR